MTTRPAGTRRPLALILPAHGRNRWRTARRGALWLLSALMLCEWRYTPATLFSEQRSALSATAIKHCRRNTPCTTRRTVGAWSDSLTYLSSGADGLLSARSMEAVPLADQVGAFERAVIEQELRKAAGSVSAVSVTLGVPKQTLYYKMQKYGLTADGYKA